MHGQHQDGQFLLPGLQLADHLQTVESGHGDIDNGHIRVHFFNQPDGFAAVIGFGDDLHVTAFFDDATQPGPHDAVVVSQ